MEGFFFSLFGLRCFGKASSLTSSLAESVMFIYQQQGSMWPSGHLTLVHVRPATGWGPSALIIDRLYRSSSTDFDKEEGHSYRCLDSNVGDNLLQKLLNINCYLVLKSSVPKSFDVY